MEPNVPGKVHGRLLEGGVGAVQPVPERQPPEAGVEPACKRAILQSEYLGDTFGCSLNFVEALNLMSIKGST